MTILPDRLSEDGRSIFKSMFPNLMELDSKQANEILVKSSPKESQLIKFYKSQAERNEAAKRAQGEKQLQQQQQQQKKPAAANGQAATLPGKVRMIFMSQNMLFHQSSFLSGDPSEWRDGDARRLLQRALLHRDRVLPVPPARQEPLLHRLHLRQDRGLLLPGGGELPQRRHHRVLPQVPAGIFFTLFCVENFVSHCLFCSSSTS